jgi:hypothetical protein
MKHVGRQIISSLQSQAHPVRSTFRRTTVLPSSLIWE